MDKIENEQEYQGWTNRETWAYALWLSNDEGYYSSIIEQIQNSIDRQKEENAELKPEEMKEQVVYDLEEYLKQIWDDLVEYTDENGSNITETARNMIKDVGSFWRVDLREVAESYIEEIEYQIKKRC